MGVDKIYDLLVGRTIALFGAGQLGEMSIDMWPSDKPKPVIFLDQSRDKPVRGIPVTKLSDYSISDELFLLSAFKMSYSQIVELFSAVQQDEILTVYDYFEAYLPESFSNGWRHLSPGPSRLSLIANSRRCFFDSRSKEIFDNVVQWRYFRIFEDNCSMIDEMFIYQVPQSELSKPFDIVLDCGSFDLGFHTNLINQGVRFSSYYAFEPDEKNFMRMEKILAKLKEQGNEKSVNLFNHGIHAFSCERYFFNSGLLSSRFVESDKVQGCSLPKKPAHSIDHFVENMKKKGKRMLIKLHIEGDELNAIIGAKETLLNNQVLLFANMSHNEKSLLQIPPLLNELGFQLTLRSHAYFGEGLTLVGRNF